ncbi:hypothetical protein D3C76_281410 [compost metagenome]
MGVPANLSNECGWDYNHFAVGVASISTRFFVFSYHIALANNVLVASSSFHVNVLEGQDA